MPSKASIYDGTASAARLPPETVDLLSAYGDKLCEFALARQRDDGTALADMLGAIIVDDEEEIVAVALTSDVLGEMIDMFEKTSSPERVTALKTFVEKPVAPTQLRVVCWHDCGFFLLRMDTVKEPKAGKA